MEQTQRLTPADRDAGITQRITYWKFTDSTVSVFKSWKRSESLALERLLFSPLYAAPLHTLPPLRETGPWILVPILRSLPKFLRLKRDPVRGLVHAILSALRTAPCVAPSLHGVKDLLVPRLNASQNQALLSRSDRMSLSFEIHPLRARVLAHSNVLLIDDLWTTGSTARAASRALYAHGAQRIDVLTLGERTFSGVRPPEFEEAQVLAASRDGSDPQSLAKAALHP